MIELMQLMLNISATSILVFIVLWLVDVLFKEHDMPEWFCVVAGLNAIICIGSAFIGGLLWIWT